MLSNVWGPYAWYLLHVLSYSYEPELRKSYEAIANTYIALIPCSVCHKHYKKMIKDYPPNFEDEEMTVKWFVDAHNRVNKRLGKSQYSVERAYHVYHVGNTLVINHGKIQKLLQLFYNGLIDYPTENRYQQMNKFLVNMSRAFPCLECRERLIDLVEKMPPTRYNVKNWIVYAGSIINDHNRQNPNIIGPKVIAPKVIAPKVIASKVIASKVVGPKVDGPKVDGPKKKGLDADEVKGGGNYIKNQSVDIVLQDVGVKVVAKQTKSTPGIKKVFNVKPGVKYSLEVVGKKNTGSEVILWISKEKGKRVIINNFLRPVETSRHAIFANDENESITVGLLFKNPKIGDNFSLKSLNLDEVK